jgi:hypothetical protein
MDDIGVKGGASVKVSMVANGRIVNRETRAMVDLISGFIYCQLLRLMLSLRTNQIVFMSLTACSN